MSAQQSLPFAVGRELDGSDRVLVAREHAGEAEVHRFLLLLLLWRLRYICVHHTERKTCGVRSTRRAGSGRSVDSLPPARVMDLQSQFPGLRWNFH